ncbi:hypothetical protein RSW84_30615, partial [Escherichia coli]|uniref:hypothetical protein n=1 Tax=Escherichia coli TaxID=562 RepID=UPI0028DEEF05
CTLAIAHTSNATSGFSPLVSIYAHRDNVLDPSDLAILHASANARPVHFSLSMGGGFDNGTDIHLV